jgi:16S rRNA (cytosine967-C5)-methyltransferase
VTHLAGGVSRRPTSAMTSPDPARRAAAALLSAVTDDGRTLETALETTRSFAPLTGRDRGFARAIASASLRHLGRIDAILAGFMDRPLGEGAEVPRAILRTAVAQLLVMDVAPHAAVSSAVGLANASSAGQPFAKLINAVLRKVDTVGRDRFATMPALINLPEWLYTRWRAAYGDATAAAIAASLTEEPPLDLSSGAGVDMAALLPHGQAGPFGAWRVRDPGDVSKLMGFEEGAWWVQDAAASLPARLLGDVRGKSVLDLCAAPGGKTMQLAAAGAEVTAVDIDEARLTRVTENLTRTGLSAKTVAADILAWTPQGLADAVLLDSPCTATGTLRRHPDAAWLRRPSDIEALAQRQKALLARAAGYLKPGGVLVYAVCSLEPEESEHVIADAPSLGLRPAPLIATEFNGLDQAITPLGWLRTLPNHQAEQGGMDGFFAARFIRT